MHNEHKLSRDLFEERFSKFGAQNVTGNLNQCANFQIELHISFKIKI